MRGLPTGHSGQQVFEILVREHADTLSAYLHSLLRRSDAVDDIFQEAMLIAWRRLDDYDRSRPFGPWLRGIAARLVLQHRRQVAGSTFNCEPAVLAALDDRYAALQRLPGDSLPERLDQLKTCLSRLPDQIRETIELVYARGLLMQQLTETLITTEEAIKKRVQRGRQMLAECLRSAEAPS